MDQITLHPIVQYTRLGDNQSRERDETVLPKDPDGEQEKVKLTHFNYVGVSSVQSLKFTTTFTFFSLLLNKICEILPGVEHVHLVTDSPSCQYRNRFACEMLRRAANIFGIRISWNWLEAGHGKGPCDGIGGALKGMADRSIKSCGAIQTVDEFIEILQPQTVKLTLMKAEKELIDKNEEVISEWQAGDVHGICTAHHGTVYNDDLYLRNTSCYKQCCLTDDLRPRCPGWTLYPKTAAPIPLEKNAPLPLTNPNDNGNNPPQEMVPEEHVIAGPSTAQEEQTPLSLIQQKDNPKDASQETLQLEEEVEDDGVELPVDKDHVVGCDEPASGEEAFSSDADEDLDTVHNTHRTTVKRERRTGMTTRYGLRKLKERQAAKAGSLNQVRQGPLQEETQPSTSVHYYESSEEEEEDESYVVIPSDKDKASDERISIERRNGRFVNELIEEEGFTSSDDWPLADNITLHRFMEFGLHVEKT